MEPEETTWSLLLARFPLHRGRYVEPRCTCALVNDVDGLVEELEFEHRDARLLLQITLPAVKDRNSLRASLTRCGLTEVIAGDAHDAQFFLRLAEWLQFFVVTGAARKGC